MSILKKRKKNTYEIKVCWSNRYKADFFLEKKQTKEHMHTYENMYLTQRHSTYMRESSTFCQKFKALYYHYLLLQSSCFTERRGSGVPIFYAGHHRPASETPCGPMMT